MLFGRPDRSSWGTSGFRRLWLAMFTSQLGFWISLTSLQWQVAAMTEADEFQVGLLYFVQLAPMLVLTPWLGTIVDTLPKDLLLRGSVTGLVVVGFIGGPALAYSTSSQLLIIQALAGCFGLLLAVNAPAFHAALPTTVAPAHLPAAISAYVAGQNVARLAGPAAAAALVGLGFTGGVAGMYALGACASIALFALLRLPRSCTRTSPLRGRVRLWPTMSMIAKQEGLRRCLLLVSVTSTFGLSYVAMLPIVALRQLRTDQSGYAALLVISGLGAVVGSLAVGRWRLRLRHASGLAMMVVLGLVMLALSPATWLASLSCFMTSAAGIALMVVSNVVIQSEVDETFRGRVMSLYVWAWGGLLPVGAMVLGVVSRALTVRTAFLLSAAALLGFIALDRHASGRAGAAD